MMKFSVLLSLYHKENPDHLRQALTSVFEQTSMPTEVVLVEDGPLTKGLDTVVAEFVTLHPEIKLIRLAKNVGLGNALNLGLEHCTYDLVARMDTDDICKSNRFERQLEMFEKRPELDVVSGAIDEFEGTIDHIISVRKIPELHHQIMCYGRHRNPINHPVVMFRKTAINRAGGYMDFPFFEDYYLWVRMLLNGAVFYNIQDSLLFFRTTKEMFRRRGGFQYACNEIVFQRTINKLGYINRETMWMNIFIRFNTRLIPNCVRSFIYRHFLRNNDSID